MEKINFTDNDLWTVINKQTEERTAVHGPLAEVLMKYQGYYTLIYSGKES